VFILLCLVGGDFIGAGIDGFQEFVSIHHIIDVIVFRHEWIVTNLLYTMSFGHFGIEIFAFTGDTESVGGDGLIQHVPGIFVVMKGS
jgi:hypothetical protein